MPPHATAAPVALGYLDPWVARPGEAVALHLSCREPFEVELVRLLDGAPAPGAAVPREPVRRVTDDPQDAVVQPVRRGSGLVVADPDLRLTATASSFAAFVWPTAPARGARQALASLEDAAGRARWRVELDPAGRLLVRAGGLELALERPLRAREWYLVHVAIDTASAVVRVEQWPLSRWLADEGEVAEQGGLGELAARGGTLRLADGGGRVGCFNGKLAAPRLWSRVLVSEEVERLARGRWDGRDVALAGDWRLEREPQSARVLDAGPHGLHGELRNAPRRAVTGPRWDGTELCFRAAPEQYDAVHFHEDDLGDAEWPALCSVAVPADVGSGVYAVRVHGAWGEELLPLFVAPRAEAHARVALLLPTLTYLAYGNMRFDEEIRSAIGSDERSGAPGTGAEERALAASGDFGLSLYDFHAGGDICEVASRRRPNLHLRPGYRYFQTGEPRHLSADLLLVGWLRRAGYAVDVLTDETLDDEGAALLDGYDVVLTGSHPEYVTARMLDALEGWVHDGGRLMYLGGNGFYWVTGRFAAAPHLIEVRRGHGGTNAGRSEPGEEHLASTGEPGGLWRHRGRSPHRLVGVGFAALGYWPRGSAYRRAEAAAPETQALLRGTASERIGAQAPLGGPAGDEIDRADVRLGTSPRAQLLASSVGEHGEEYFPCVEDLGLVGPGLGGPQDARVRADMVLVESPGGGAVFSVGSINWVLGLGARREDPDVAAITRNVLERFLGGAAAAGRER